MASMPRSVSPGVDRWMLPGELARAADSTDPDPPGRPAPRTARDWAVDVTMFLIAVLVAVATFPGTVLQNLYELPTWIRVADPVLGAAACLALWWRRRFPVALGIFAAVAAALSNTATGAVVLLLFSVALHRGWKWAAPIACASVLLGTPYILMYFPGSVGPPVLWLVILTLSMLLLVTLGLAVRARRQLVLVLRMRADTLRREQERQLEESRRSERARIAREMHDVLAHRISLLSVHAGALEYRTAMAESGAAPPPTAVEVRRAVAVVRSNAHQALEELRDVLQVLRLPDATEATQREDTSAAPQPTADRLPALLDEARQSGQRVRENLGCDLVALRPALQRTVFRLVQEGLTNARKHAPGAEVEVAVRGEPGGDVVVEISNPSPVGVTTGEIPGAGAGLTGLAERVALHGGELAREVSGGHFRLRAQIPWTS